MNLLEERLSVVQRQKQILRANLKSETDRGLMMDLAEKIRILNEEEKELLNKLGLK